MQEQYFGNGINKIKLVQRNDESICEQYFMCSIVWEHWPDTPQ